MFFNSSCASAFRQFIILLYEKIFLCCCHNTSQQTLLIKLKFTDKLYSVNSYFEKGCRKKCTRQSRKVLGVVLSSLFFKEIWRNGTRGKDVCFRMLKESSNRRFDSYFVSNSVLIISHITFRESRVHIFFRQPYSK